MNKRQYTIEVLVNGKPVKEYLHKGNTYIEAREGTKYSIKIKNNSYRRIKAVITVDGFSILTDDKSDQNSGYVINGHDSLHIKGHRTAEDKESVFFFTSKGNSRAQKSLGYAKNCGVIGVKIYAEKLPEYNWTPIKDWWAPLKKWDYPNDHIRYNSPTSVPNNSSWGSISDTMNYSASYNTETPVPSNGILCKNASTNSYSAQEYSPKFSMGTGMGEEVKSNVEYVIFNTGNLESTFELFYLPKKEMVKMGIDLSPKKKLSMPNAFPKFCKKV